jgi:hypothetical protein
VYVIQAISNVRSIGLLYLSVTNINTVVDVGLLLRNQPYLYWKFETVNRSAPPATVTDESKNNVVWP